MTVYAFSSFTFSYLDRARVLAKSLKKFHPDWKLWAVITDKPPKDFVFDLQSEQFDGVLTVEDLFGEDADQWLFGHDLVEACTAVKGPATVRLLEFSDCRKLFFFDPDIALFDSMDQVVELLDGYSIVLTPHQIDPDPRKEMRAILDNEIGSLVHGVFNLGFIALANDEEGRRFAAWWSDRLLDWCHDDRESGLFVDQKWCNLVPCFFDRVKVLRDPGYNVASWNLSRRSMSFDVDGKALVNGRPLRFYHFTKYGPVGEQMVQRYAGNNVEVFELWWWYGRQIEKAAPKGIPKNWWFYGTYEDGTPVGNDARHIYRAHKELRRSFPRPFRSGEDTFSAWLTGRNADTKRP